jgi:transposase
VAEALAVSWDTANDAVLAEGRRVLIADPDRFDGVTVIGVDEQAWRHTRRGDKYAAVPAALTELITLGRTLKRRTGDVLAYFDRPGTSNGPTEAINGRLEHLRGSALGFRNLTHYIARSPLETGGFRPRLHPRSG